MSEGQSLVQSLATRMQLGLLGTANTIAHSVRVGRGIAESLKEGGVIRRVRLQAKDPVRLSAICTMGRRVEAYGGYLCLAVAIRRDVTMHAGQIAYWTDAEVQKDYERLAQTANGFWNEFRELLYPQSLGGLVIAGLPQVKRLGEPLRSIANGRTDALLDTINVPLVQSALGRGQALDEGAAARLLGTAIWPEQRSAAFTYAGLGMDARSEPHVLHREIDIASFHYRSGLRTPPQQLEVAGGRAWTSADLDRLAAQLIEATPFDQPDTVPLPLWLARRQLQDVSRIDWLQKYQQDVFQTLRSGELDKAWLRGWEPEGA